MAASVGEEAIQRFSFGYELITWDLKGESLDNALGLLAAEGFGWFESLLGDTLGGDFARRNLTLGPVSAPRIVPDFAMFDRLAFFAEAYRNHGVRLASLFVDGDWINPNLWQSEFAKVQVLTRFLRSCEAPIMVCGGGPSEGSVKRTNIDYRAFAGRLEELGRFTAEFDIRTVYHPHLDTFIETREQLDRLMDILDTSLVGLCIDPAHFQIKEDDPVDIFKTYGSQIDYVHLKDCKGDERTLKGHDRFRAFCELGAGIVDLQGIIDELVRSQYDGPVIVELDYSETSDESCRRNASFIRNVLGLAITGA